MDTSRDPEPYNVTTSQDNLLPIYQQEARCMWTSIARNREIVAQHGWIKTVPISDTESNLMIPERAGVYHTREDGLIEVVD